MSLSDSYSAKNIYPGNKLSVCSVISRWDIKSPVGTAHNSPEIHFRERDILVAKLKTRNMLLTHRPIEEKDIAVICGFPQNAEELFFMFPKASYPLTPDQLREAISDRSDSTVAEADGKIVGFANFYRWETEGRCSIGNVIIAPAARTLGVGRYLIGQMIGIAFSKYRAAEVTVSCFNQNVAGLLFYPKLGFHPYAVEERHDKNGNRIALIHLRLGARKHSGNPKSTAIPFLSSPHPQPSDA